MLDNIRATKLLFQRTKGQRDLDGNMVYDFTEYVPIPSCIRVTAPDVQTLSDGSQIALRLNRRWQILVTQSGVRYGTLKVRDAIGLQTRALRRIEEDHLMKFAIPGD